MDYENKTNKTKLLYFPLGKLSREESIFQDPAKGIFKEKFKSIFTPILGKQLALNTYYQNDLIASANTRITIALLRTFDSLKINFKVNNTDITENEKNHALYDAMSQIIMSKVAFMNSIKDEDVPEIQSSVHTFISQALNQYKINSFQNHFDKVQGYLEFANSVITSEKNYIGTVAALKKIIENEQSLFNLNKNNTGETIQHSMKTAWISLTLATELDDFDEEDYEKLSIICLAHDCGKALIPNEIIYKKGRLTQLESDIMKSHVLFSFILSSNNQINLTFESFVMAMHHIKENKKIPHSYGITPDTYTSFHDYLTPKAQQALKEIEPDTIKFYRLMSIADTFEAITAERVYKKGSSIGKTIEIMQKENRDGEQFHTPYLDALIRLVIKFFLPRHLIFKLSDELIDTYYSDSEFTNMDKKFYQKNYRGVVVEPSSRIDDAVKCVIFNHHNKRVERNLDILPMHLLHQRYLT
ncbi:HD-GYP domain family protein [Desulfamplus magnetovallimortis]|uniref:HD-GYP domain family protein n=1 Tax=Desulfamplus magnetovallimortis TaxID=1246637 RepID=A0A1W1H817_9BACT|nr:HD domain-containing protein [Desulfamplus magnetovallimortis]SLM28611.1 HD-GYP domain family protein [Desulfamplus magnetovallimortis]